MTVSREDRMIAAVEELRGKPFDWATFNCGLAAAEIARSYCGKDYAKKFRPLCKGKLSAMRSIKKHGGLAGAMKHLGFKEIPVGLARRCDCVLTKGERPALGIVYDGRRAVFPSQFGLAFVDVLECSKAWRVE